MKIARVFNSYYYFEGKVKKCEMLMLLLFHPLPCYPHPYPNTTHTHAYTHTHTCHLLPRNLVKITKELVVRNLPSLFNVNYIRFALCLSI